MGCVVAMLVAKQITLEALCQSLNLESETHSKNVIVARPDHP